MAARHVRWKRACSRCPGDGWSRLYRKNAGSAPIVSWMDDLFAIEAREQSLNHAERDALRQQPAPALLEPLRVELLAMQKRSLPKSAAGEVANDALSLWTMVTVFLQRPELELSNHFTENAVRTVALERNNWLHLGRKAAGLRIAAIFSVVEIAAASACPCASTWPMFCPAPPTAPSRSCPVSPLPLTPPIRQKNLHAHYALRQPRGCSDAYIPFAVTAAR